MKFGKYSKDLTIKDESGKNTAILKIGSNDKSYLESKTSESYTLIPVLTNQTYTEAVDAFYGIEEQREGMQTDNQLIDNEEPIVETFLRLESTNLANGVKDVILVPTPSDEDDLRLDWQYETIFSKHWGLEGQGSNITCWIVGNNSWRDGYYGIWEALIGPDVFVNVENHTYQKQIHYWQEVDVTRYDVYEVKMKRKYKSTKHPSVIFGFTR